MLATLVLAAALTAPPTATNHQPDFALEQAAREFRIAVYDSFRKVRDEYDARRAVGDELFEAWIKAEHPAEHRAAVLAWFAEAARASRAGEALAPFAQLDELRNVTLTVELPAEATTFEPVSPVDQKSTPPAVLDEKPADEKSATEKPAATQSLFSRLKKSIFSSKTGS